MLAMVVDCLTSIGLREFQVSVGNVEFYQSLFDNAGLTDEAEERVRELITNRNFFGVEEFLDGTNVRRSAKEALVSLGELCGGVEILQKAKDIAPNTKAIMAVRRLEQIYEMLKLYGVEKYITFDFSMSGTYGYYTGIIFRGYTYGTGDAIVKGGRYDHLLEKFGKQSPSIGFALVIDELMKALSRQKIHVSLPRKNTLIIYDESKMPEAISLAKDFRDKCKNTELLKKQTDKSVDDYIAYGKEYYASNMIYLQANDQILMVNLVTDEQKIFNSEV